MRRGRKSSPPKGVDRRKQRPQVLPDVEEVNRHAHPAHARAIARAGEDPTPLEKGAKAFVGGGPVAEREGDDAGARGLFAGRPDPRATCGELANELRTEVENVPTDGSTVLAVAVPKRRGQTCGSQAVRGPLRFEAANGSRRGEVRKRLHVR